MKKLIALIMTILVVVSLCACNANTNTTEIDIPYSVGLRDDGYYENYEDLGLKTYAYDLVVKENDVLDFAMKVAQYNLADLELTVDDYLEMYANDLLSAMGLDEKEVAEKTDTVVASLVFADGEEEMTEYGAESQQFVISDDNDSIVDSFIGHKAGDEYTVDYTFDETADDYANKTVQVNITIEGVYYADALNSGIVEKNLDAINEVVGTEVTDIATFTTALKPYLVGYHLEDYIKDYLSKTDIAVPDEWTNIELERLKSRLQSLDITYEQYKTASEMTDDEIREICEQAARENMIALAVYSEMFEPLTEEQLEEEYTEYDYHVLMQGEPYMKLKLMRTMAYEKLATMTTVVDNDNNTIDMSVYFDLQIEAEETGTNEVDVDSTEETNAENETEVVSDATEKTED